MSGDNMRYRQEVTTECIARRDKAGLPGRRMFAGGDSSGKGGRAPYTEVETSAT
jgi:hypothetical protein